MPDRLKHRHTPSFDPGADHDGRKEKKNSPFPFSRGLASGSRRRVSGRTLSVDQCPPRKPAGAGLVPEGTKARSRGLSEHLYRNGRWGTRKFARALERVAFARPASVL